MKPIVKWAGGKRKILPELRKRLPEGWRTRRYVEPFCGGAALFFDTTPEDAVLSDVNRGLIRTYAFVRDRPDQVLEELQLLAAQNTESEFYVLREEYNARERFGVREAALFIYLNKTCFNGLYRENKSGHFNVPYGDYVKPAVFDPEGLIHASNILRKTTLYTGDFSSLLHICKGEEFVYIDPPYYTDSGNFTAYSAQGFGPWHHRRLAWVVKELHARGCKVLLSNSSEPFVRDLYADFTIDEIDAPRSVGADPETRKPVRELVIRNYSVNQLPLQEEEPRVAALG